MHKIGDLCNKYFLTKNKWAGMLGRLDSLNVSVSAAILLFEAVRQRN